MIKKAIVGKFSMSNQFYDYLADKLINFFKHHSLNEGDRFLINFDTKNQVNNFCNVLKREKDGDFNFRYNNSYDEFNTFFLTFNGVDLIVTGSDVTPDFLVTLRNFVSTAEGEWKNKALLIVSDNIKDSINGGMKNLNEKGYPFSLDYIIDNLSNDINKSNLSKYDKEILSVYLSNEEEGLYKVTLWDFEYVLSIINKGVIEDSDYEKLDMFPDSSLINLEDTRARKNRIKSNNELFLEIENKINFSDYEKELEKKFDTSGIKKLKDRENWKNTDYKILYNSQKAFNEKNKPIKLEKVSIKENLPYWDFPEKDTVAGRRKRHIIVFNTKKLTDISLSFTFDRELDRSFLTGNYKNEITKSKNRLIANLNLLSKNEPYSRYIYTHEKLTKNRFSFNILVVNVDPEDLKSIKGIYNLSNKKPVIVINKQADVIEFGTGEEYEVILKENDQDIDISKSKVKILIDDSLNYLEDDLVSFNLIKGSESLHFIIKEISKKTPPINALNIWSKKLENKTDFRFNGSRLEQLDKGYNIVSDDLKEFLNLEKEIIGNNILSGSYKNGSIASISLNLSPELSNAYDELFSYYKEKNNIPSLVYLDDNLKKIYEKIVDVFNKEVSEISEGSILKNTPFKSDLNKIGLIIDNNRILYSSISPLNIAYQLEVSKQYSREFKTEISKRLNYDNLLPHIYGLNDELYRPIQQDVIKEWLIYENAAEVSIGSTNVFLRKVVSEKLQQFVTHFAYLFNEDSKAPLKINVINLKDDKEIVKGVFDFIRGRLPDKRKTGNIIPVEISIYDKESHTYFDEFFKCRTNEDLENKFGMTVKSTTIDSLDIIRIVQENINYYVNSKENEIYNYAHISFYKSAYNSKPSNYNMGDIDTGLSLNGLLSSHSSCSSKEDYRVGFGTKYANMDCKLIKLAANLNELIYNSKNGGSDTYEKDKVIVTLSKEDKDSLDVIYDSSHWVTFIEPNFGLDYFSDQNDLFVIHYSDQYSSSSLYDTITVTNNSEQYSQIINDFLKVVIPTAQWDEEVIESIIKLFNSINGEWLLNLGLKDIIEREKLSVISAIKYALVVFDNEDVIWVPISMEEILRVAGNVGLKEKNGLFSVKNLIGGKKGAYSDDLLLIGVNIDKFEVYYYPIEVKIGINAPNVINKAKEQIHNTVKLLEENLIKSNSFIQKFYRNFFVQLLLSNQQKLINNKVWDEKDFDKINNFKTQLLNDDYVISRKLHNEIGKGAIISFKDDLISQSVYQYDDVTLIELPSKEGYYGIIRYIDDLNDLIHEDGTDIPSKTLLKNKNISAIECKFEYDYKDSVQKNEEILDDGDYQINNDDIDEMHETDINDDFNPDKEETPTKQENSRHLSNGTAFDENGRFIGVSKNAPSDDEVINEDNEWSVESENYDGISDSNESNITKKENIPLEDVRPLIGYSRDYNEQIYWEFGNPNLANRHMFIQGKSGQGKTYFIQRMINELSMSNISTLIIDYTNGFTDAELDVNLKKNLGDKIKQHIVYVEDFPLNPFKRYNINIGGMSVPQKDVDVAGRFKSIIRSVYNLGDQQLNAIYNAVINGLKHHGDNMDLEKLKDELNSDSIESARTAVSRLNQLLDVNPFNSDDSFDWSILDTNPGDVIIIQLTGLAKEIQKVVSEIILWDLWYYKEQNGSEKKPFAVVLDEAQNLDFTNSSPCGKILAEGRKFGWSAWFATQSSKSFKSDALSKLGNVEEKIFFNPTSDSVSSIAKSFSYNNADKKKWEKELRSLNKGQCIVNAPLKGHDGELKHVNPIVVNVDSIE